jgi:hypothetical protein
MCVWGLKTLGKEDYTVHATKIEREP